MERAIAGSSEPVMMFALEWCEFCWALRRFFKRIGVAYRSVDLDSTGWQAANRGGQVRTALYTRLGQSTIPQVFVAGEWIGGCTDTFEAWRSGKLQALLVAAGATFDAAAVRDPASFLPAWMQGAAAPGR